MGKDWGRGLPVTTYTGTAPQDFAFSVRVKALHHWLRKKQPGKAYAAACAAFHQGNRILDRRERG